MDGVRNEATQLRPSRMTQTSEVSKATGVKEWYACMGGDVTVLGSLLHTLQHFYTCMKIFPVHVLY